MYKTEIVPTVLYYYNRDGKIIVTPNVNIAVGRNQSGDITVETITGAKREHSTLIIE